MDDAARDRLVHVKIAIADFKVVAALGVRAGPGFVVDRGALAAEIRQRHQVTRLAPLALWKNQLHFTLPLPFSGGISASITKNLQFLQAQPGTWPIPPRSRGFPASAAGHEPISKRPCGISGPNRG